MKQPKCKICGGPHYKTWCPKAARKPIARTAIKRPSYEQAIEKARKAPLKPRKVKAHKVTQKPARPLKRARVQSQSQSYRATLIRQADRIFSLYVRRKDSVANTARCVTCGKRDHYKAMQNGHYISRRVMRVRFDIRNAHVQCPRCNMELGGNMKAYNLFMLEKYGLVEVESLKKLAKTGGKVTTVELNEIVKKYTHLLNSLE